MNRYIDADALMGRMYHEAFENDASYNESNPMAKWDSGLWIRYKMFENVIDEAPSIDICFCRECKLGGTEDCPMDEIDDEYFCNFGEREEASDDSRRTDKETEQA